MSPHSNNPPEDNRITPDTTDREMPAHVRTGYQKYKQFEPFAEGGSSRLELCLDTNLFRNVVLKRLHPHLAGNKAIQRRFLREARVTAQMMHPNVVPVYELSRDHEGNLYFTMKRLHGRTLLAILQALSTGDPLVLEEFPLAHRIEVLLQICFTIAYAHSHGVVHRDLKPENILLGSFGEVVVLDWGLAKVRGGFSDLEGAEKNPSRIEVSPEIDKTDSRYGTPLYMSPEQAEGHPDVGEPSDIYNLGILLYEMLALRPVVWGDNVQQVIHHILHTPPTPPRRIRPKREIPKELEAICLKALAKHPGDRYPSVLAFIDDIRAWQADRTVSAMRNTPLQGCIRFSRRHPALRLAILFLFLGVAMTRLAHVWGDSKKNHPVLNIASPGFAVRLLPAGTAPEEAIQLGVSPMDHIPVAPGEYQVILEHENHRHEINIRMESGDVLHLLPSPH